MGNLAIYATKGYEYLLILGFLALFTLFYLYFTSRRFEHVSTLINKSIQQMVDWIRVPDNVLFHQGHTWVRQEAAEPEVVLVGMDDFAQKLAGPVGIRGNPMVGSHIRQGERAWSLQDGRKSVDMLAPISGEVVELNIGLLAELENHSSKVGALDEDPYDKGWILKVRPENFERERKALLTGSLARKWMEEVSDRLRLKMSPELGVVMQDGGRPMPGMAKNINGEKWDQLLKEFFLT